MLDKLSPLSHLKIRWGLALVLYLLVLVSSSQLFFTNWHVDRVVRWAVGAALGLAIHLGILWWGLSRNHRHNDPLILPTFGYGNAVTLTRGLLVSLLAGFLFVREPQSSMAWLPALLYLLSSLLDYLDGYIARITNHSTVLGEILDMEFDGLGMLIAISVAICYGQLPLWYLLLGLGRQLFLAGLWLRQRAGLSINEMMPSANRRIIAGIQMGFICVILWPILTPPLTTITCILFSIPLAASFGRDWLVVSGQLRPNTNRYQMLHRWSRRIIQAWGPVACRTIGTLIGSWFMWRSWPQLYAWHGLVETIQIDSIRSVWLGLLLSAPFFLVTYAAGILGRVSALLLLAVAFTDLIVGGPNLLNILFLTTLAWVIQFGSGLFSIWSPEEALLRRRAGTQP